jgi:hypothetical protein
MVENNYQKENFDSNWIGIQIHLNIQNIQTGQIEEIAHLFQQIL